MKSTKIMLVAALAAGSLIIGSSSLRAQDATNTPPPAMKARANNLAKALDLTDAQKPKFDAIMKDAMAKRKALREDDSLTPEDKKAKAKAIQEDTATQLKAVLTPEQFTKYEEMTKKMRRNKPPGGAGAPPVAPAAPPQA